MFFADRLGNGLRQAGHHGRVVDTSMEEVPGVPIEAELVIVDLEAGEAALTAIRSAKAAGLPVLSFGPHTDLALRETALTSGADKVVAKSKLVSSFAELIAEMTQG